MPQQVLLLPTQWMGASHHHLRFGATLSLHVDNHVAMLCDLLTPLLEDGYQRLLLLNGHGGNIDTMQMALRRLQPQWRDRILAAASYWDMAAKELAALGEGPRKSMGHACEYRDVDGAGAAAGVGTARPDQGRSAQRRPGAAP